MNNNNLALKIKSKFRYALDLVITFSLCSASSGIFLVLYSNTALRTVLTGTIILYFTSLIIRFVAKRTYHFIIEIVFILYSFLITTFSIVSLNKMSVTSVYIPDLLFNSINFAPMLTISILVILSLILIIEFSILIPRKYSSFYLWFTVFLTPGILMHYKEPIYNYIAGNTLIINMVLGSPLLYSLTLLLGINKPLFLLDFIKTIKKLH